MNSENSTSCRLRTSLGGTWMDLSQQAGSTITLIIRNICTDVNQVVYLLASYAGKLQDSPLQCFDGRSWSCRSLLPQDVQRSVVAYLLS